MAKPCQICIHPDRDKIDYELLRGVTCRQVFRTYDIKSYDAIVRHKKHHLCSKKDLIQIDEVIKVETIGKKLDYLYRSLLEIFEDAKRKNKGKLAVLVAGEIRKLLESFVKLTGDVMDERIIINISPSDFKTIDISSKKGDFDVYSEDE